MVWKLNGDGPVYQQLMGVIRGAVLSGTYGPGDRIPSVRELASEAQVNPNTMQRALSELEREGVLESQGTLGRIVTHDGAVLEQIRSRAVTALAEECAARFRALGICPRDVAPILQRLEEKEGKT